MTSREEIDRALSEKIGSERVRSFLLKNVQRSKAGTYFWRINLPALRNNLPRIMDGLLNAENEGVGGLEEIPPGGISRFSGALRGRRRIRTTSALRITS